MNGETSGGVDYAGVLADLKAKRDALDKAIAAIEMVTGQSTTTGTAQSGTTEEIRDDAFFGMTIPDAAKKLLAIKKRPQSTQEIAELLRSGGMLNTSDNFANTVGTVLNRADRNNAGIVKVGRGKWGLSDWYPGRRKAKREDDDQEGSDEDEQAAGI